METIKKLTRQQAINAHCKECIYDPGQAGTWRKQVEMCTTTRCNLYAHRPTTIVANPNPGPQPEWLRK